MKKITSTSGGIFVSNNYDDTGNVWKGDFIWLFCNKTITEKSVSFEYPSVIFKQLNMVKSSDVVSVEGTNEEETEIFNRINGSAELTKENKAYLKNNFLKLIDTTIAE